MNYRVIIQPSAQAEMEEAYLWVHDHAPLRIAKWCNGLVEAILSLANHPQRCSLAPESDAFDEEINQLLFGKRTNVYRILFTIQENTVSVLHVRHAARRFLNPGQE
jgi:plasmid stabilization system protein ParE